MFSVNLEQSHVTRDQLIPLLTCVTREGTWGGLGHGAHRPECAHFWFCSWVVIWAGAQPGAFLGTDTLHLLPVLAIPTSDLSIPGWSIGRVGGGGGQFSVLALSHSPSARVQRMGLFPG